MPALPAPAVKPRTFLWSVSFYADLLQQLAAIAPVPDIVEVGSESGETSVLLAEIAATRGGRLAVVEPFPSARLRELQSQRPDVAVVEGCSPDALPDAGPAGLYILDGDHNYATVSSELRAVFGANPGAIAVLHDIGWPAGRRDQYYDPARLAPGDVQPHRWDAGAYPDVPALVPGGGFRGEGAFAFATYEGGPRNGVRTAIEDFLVERPGHELLATPLIFGLGVVGATSEPMWARVREVMAPYVDNPTLEAMERNRLDLLLRVIDLQTAHWPHRIRRSAKRLRHSFGGVVHQIDQRRQNVS
jgi:hypothetical protein